MKEVTPTPRQGMEIEETGMEGDESLSPDLNSFVYLFC